MPVIVGFAAESGQAAYAGQGRNSMFTAALLSSLSTYGTTESVGQLLARVGSEVAHATGNQQVPSICMTLTSGDVPLVRTLGALPYSPAEPALPLVSVLGPLQRAFDHKVGVWNRGPCFL